MMWSHGSCDSSVWRHIFWENDIFSVSSGMKQHWTDVLDCYSDRKSGEHNKCGKGKTRDHLSAMWHSEPWGLSFDSVLCVATMSTSPFPHLPVTPLLITAIMLSREGISYHFLSFDDGWHQLFSRVCEQASITQSITARSASWSQTPHTFDTINQQHTNYKLFAWMYGQKLSLKLLQQCKFASWSCSLIIAPRSLASVHGCIIFSQSQQFSGPPTQSRMWDRGPNLCTICPWSCMPTFIKINHFVSLKSSHMKNSPM